MAKRRHHYVPAFLLGRFASPPGRSGALCALDKDTGRPRRTSPNNVAVEKDYNAYVGVPEVDPLFPEELYEQIENEAAPLIVRIGQRTLFMDDAARAALALFVSSLWLRVPRGRAFLKDADEAFARALLLSTDDETVKEALANARDEPLATEEITRQRLSMIDAVVNEQVVVKAPQARTIASTLEMAVDLSRIFFDLEWTVLHARDHERFVLSDCPVALYDPTLPPGGVNAILPSPDAQTTLPLDPRFALLIEAPKVLPPIGEPVLRHADVDDQVVREIALRTYAWAQRWVYGRQHDVTQVRSRAKRQRQRLADVSPRESRIEIRLDAQGIQATIRPRRARASNR